MPSGDGSTLNYSFILPDPGGAVSTWGISLNSNWTAIDGYLKTNSDAIAAVAGRYGLNSANIARGPDGGAYGTIGFYSQSFAHPRWILYESSEAESGAAVGTNFGLNAYNNDGTYGGNVFSISRATRRISVANDPVGATDVATKRYVDAGIAPIGAIIMWPGPTLPTGWTWCLGAHLNSASYPQLFAVIGGTYFWDGTNFGLPNLAGRTVLGYDGGGWYLGRLDGEYTHTLGWGEMPVHNHSITDVQHYHNLANDSHTHGASQDDHIHGDFGHVHGVSASQDDHTHTVGTVVIPGGSGVAPGFGAQGGTLTTSGASQSNVYVSIATGYANLGGATANGVYIAASGTNAYANWAYSGIAGTNNAGSGAAHNNMQPSIVLGFIIRFA